MSVSGHVCDSIEMGPGGASHSYTFLLVKNFPVTMTTADVFFEFNQPYTCTCRCQFSIIMPQWLRG